MNKQDNIIPISNKNLHEKNNYSEQVLIDNIDKLFPSVILKTQKNLSDDFIIKYILSEDYAKIREDHDITINDLSNYFPNFGK